MAPLLNEDRRRAHKLRNLAHSALLIIGLGTLTGVCAWLVWGFSGVIGAGTAMAVMLFWGPRVSPELVMRLYRARALDPGEAGPLHELVQTLSRRAELTAIPRLYVVPSPTPNAFAVGNPDKASIALSHGLLRKLNLRQLTGVLAHEMSHIANNDLWIMGLADSFNRLTQLLSYAAFALFLFNIPVVMMGGKGVPWIVVILLYIAPIVGSLLQMALSRAREYDADLEGAMLTGDPAGLAQALQKLENAHGHFWEEIVLPGRRMPQPSLLRTHPPTEERVRRLMSLKQGPAIDLPTAPAIAVVPAVPRHPRPSLSLARRLVLRPPPRSAYARDTSLYPSW